MSSRVESTAAPVEAPAPRTSARDRVARVREAHPGINEVGIFAIALVLYQLSRAFVVGDPRQAFHNAAEIIRLEQASGLFVELNIQQWLVQHLRVVELLNVFYMYGHWIITPAFFVWLYHRRRDLYPYVRNAFLAANAIALTVFMLFPVAPPRMFSTDGFIDTLSGVSDIDLHGGALSGWFNPHAAVPSMHFGYAFMIGIVACLLVRNWPLRLAMLAYPGLVFLTITGTANHYVVDSMAGGLVMAMGFVLVQLWSLAPGRGELQPVYARVRRGRYPA